MSSTSRSRPSENLHIRCLHMDACCRVRVCVTLVTLCFLRLTCKQNETSNIITHVGLHELQQIAAPLLHQVFHWSVDSIHSMGDWQAATSNFTSAGSSLIAAITPPQPDLRTQTGGHLNLQRPVQCIVLWSWHVLGRHCPANRTTIIIITIALPTHFIINITIMMMRRRRY